METKFHFSLPQLCPPRVCSVCHIWRGPRHRSRYKVLFSKSISDCPFIMSSLFKMTRGAALWEGHQSPYAEKEEPGLH
uniref:Uncharacterized protein n=1 Tax=Peromyscus maniculatus bairdii TaxID=230844 RepID=A0A8C8UM98_PERMB